MIRICFVNHNDENNNIIIIPGTFRHFLSMCMSRWRQHLQHSLQQLRPRCRGSPRRAPAAGCVSRIAGGAPHQAQRGGRRHLPRLRQRPGVRVRHGAAEPWGNAPGGRGEGA